MKRNFAEWLSTFRNSISTYDYYVDFEKVYKNIDSIKIELNIMNSLVGSKNIEEDFEMLARKYPEIIKCIPILLAVRTSEMFAMDEETAMVYSFNNECSLEEYKKFMKKTGLFELISNHIINNVVDYVLGVEVGLDSNGRKNRGGHLMEDLVEKYIKKAGFIKDQTYFKEMYIHEITERWGIDLSNISNNGKSEKRFDYVIKTSNCIYGIETNFYTGGGSKLNETAKSYKLIALESKEIEGFEFVWVTDGKQGWNSARKSLEETFDILDNIYCINDLEKGVINKVVK